MLAYVFWHSPRPAVAIGEYETRIRAFQEVLEAARPDAGERATVWRVDGAPWLPGGTGYEDWYLLENSAGLDTLNRRAVSGSVRVGHDHLAALSAGGTAGLYQTVEQDAAEAGGSTAVWFAKPAGIGYADLHTMLSAVLPRLWSRMMVLGPTPEFCLLESDGRSIPEGAGQLLIHRQQVWPAASENSSIRSSR